MCRQNTTHVLLWNSLMLAEATASQWECMTAYWRLLIKNNKGDIDTGLKGTGSEVRLSVRSKDQPAEV